MDNNDDQYQEIDSGPHSLPEERQLFQSLSLYYQSYADQNRESLEAAWQRIQQRQFSRTTKNNLQEEMHTERIISMQSRVQQKKDRSRWQRPVSQLIAVALIGIIVGSLAIVLNLSSHKRSHITQHNSTSTAGSPSASTGSPSASTRPPQVEQPSGIYITSEETANQFAVSRLDKTTHAIIWKHLVGSINSKLTVTSDAVYVSGYDQTNAYVFALNVKDGSERWHVQLGSLNVGLPGSFSEPLGFLTRPAEAGGSVYVQQRSGKLFSLDAQTGQINWSYDAQKIAFYDGTIYDPASVSVVNGVVYSGVLNLLFAVDAKSGKQLWRQEVESDQIVTSPVVDNKMVYLASASASKHVGGQKLTGYVYAFGAQDGQKRWTHAADSWILSDPVVANGRVYYGSYGFTVTALDAATGKDIWNYPLGGEVFASPIVDNGVVYVQAEGNATPGKQNTAPSEVFALKAEDGALIWKQQTGSTPEAVQDGIIYSSDFPRTLATFNASDGSMNWTIQVGADLLDKLNNHVGSAPEIVVIP
ncbi:outer membrane protein assembly factor BamB family protein [Tengunoibacter tsumagoiensis]|uniref:Pyrrolo-quinoline quinone repeat domain-containing protein n=1 Tax=Tengunoibacter tsumagoiensis TaxID=2014871 RepID=A0A401ZVX7_9CHLR|nr:PQQ-binding-like beta-propeller repeat protein [Tengunoibacter tsumagoiensis]GCE10956.1 hypothetical protein KTT_08150 [Tengunoibacter tsumagoiensis]